MRAVILHDTGEADLDKILKFYTAPDGLGPHYFIEVTGTIRRLVDEDHIAYHAKIEESEARLYMAGYSNWCKWSWGSEGPFCVGAEMSNYAAWKEQWMSHGYRSPLDLVTRDHPNSCSIGIELQHPSEPTPLWFTPEQYAAAGELIADICKRRSLVVSRETVLTHADVSPMRRCNSHGPWDPPGSFSFNELWDAMRPAPR